MKRKTNLFTVSLLFCLTLAFISCSEEWPGLTEALPGDGTAWANGGYHLKSTAAAVGDTLILYQGVASTFAVEFQGVIVNGVDFDFGDGDATTGSTVSHTYTATGKYLLKAIMPDGTIISGPIKVVLFGEPIADECIISIYHTMTGGQSLDTIGLLTTNVDKAESQGSWFITGDFNSWATPDKALKLTKTRIVNGKTYLLWGISHPIGLEKFNYGKMVTGESTYWNFSPKSIYWNVSELWIYFTNLGISHLPEGSNLVGTFGDNDPDNWIIRHSLTYGAEKATLTTFVHKTKITSPNNPQLVYKIGANGTWTSKTLTDGTNYSAVVDNIPYGSIVYYYVLAKAGDISTKIAAGTNGYNADASACLLQINDPYQ